MTVLLKEYVPRHWFARGGHTFPPFLGAIIGLVGNLLCASTSET